MVAFTKAIFLSLGLSATGHAFKPVLWADTNRDGEVNKDDGIKGKAEWKPEMGAIFMANIGDSERRCQNYLSNDTPDEDLSKCNDASDNKQRNLRYMARMLIPPTPGTLPGEGVTAKIMLSGDYDQVGLASSYIRIFKLKPGGDEHNAEDWKKLKLRSGSDHFSGKELVEGIKLGIDASDFAGLNNNWNGLVTLTLETYYKGECLNTDDVQLQVAPLLTHHNLQPLERVFTTAIATIDTLVNAAIGEESLPAIQQMRREFADTIEMHSKQANTPVTTVDHVDLWIQDWFESGYTSIPGKGGKPEVLRVYIRSARKNCSQDRKVFTEMRSATVGAVQMSFPREYSPSKRLSLQDVEGMGNLETIPPYSVGTMSYPNGRPIVGRRDNELPRVFHFLKAQGSDPVYLDTTWLAVGHIDEVVQFLPWKKSAENPFGWVAAFVDPRAGVALLKDAKDGANTAAMSREDIEKQLGIPKTVADLLSERELDTVAEQAGQEVDSMIDRFLKETGLPREVIKHIPTVFHVHPGKDGAWAKTMFNKPPSAKFRRYINTGVDIDAGFNATEVNGGNNAFMHRRGVDDGKLASLYANTVNGLVLNNKYLFPRPYGPVFEAQDGDILAKATADKLREGGLDSDSIDDWWSHHVNDGEVHCGTNALRDASQPWWLTWGQRADAANLDSRYN